MVNKLSSLEEGSSRLPFPISNSTSGSPTEASLTAKPEEFPTRPSLTHRPTDVGSAIGHQEPVDDATSLASIDRPPNIAEKLPPAKIYHPLSPAVLALLMPTSVFGALARLGLQALVTYDGQSIFSLAYIQAIGCLIMGIGLGVKEPLGNFYGPLYTALTTGFCGSFTTFSGWQLDVFNSWINEKHDHRDWLRDVIDGSTKLFFTLSISLASLNFGIHLASLIAPHIPSIRPPSRNIRYGVTVLSILIYFATYPAYFRLPDSFRHKATAALLFSFPGTLTRYLLSISLNSRFKLLPMGTLAANAFGTGLLATFHVLQGLPDPVSPNACVVLQGLADGYCGCLTTVSTFAAEVYALKKRKAWTYVAVSLFTGQLLMLVIMGPSFWAGNVSEQGSCQFA